VFDDVVYFQRKLVSIGKKSILGSIFFKFAQFMWTSVMFIPCLDEQICVEHLLIRCAEGLIVV
tara:strand:- start:491 stop:679 length:189 start_codon:yes stop_codon:yes gene_type:complete